MKNLIIISFAALVLSFAGCGTSDTNKLIVASERANCMGVAPQKCLLIKEDGATEWSFFYSSIEGFDYQPGFEYELEIKKETIANPPADHSSVRYILVKVISKTEKHSEGLPASAIREE